MKTKPTQHRVNLVTLGCAKNVVDSEVMLTQLQANGIDAHHESADPAQVAIINTCGFIDNAKEESINTILRYVEAKKAGDVEKVYVTGCLSERYRDDLRSEIPEVDDWFGTMELPLLLQRFNADYKEELVGERLTTTAAHFSYLKISEGCDRPCSFCAIPLMRGKHRSTPMETLVEQATNLAKRGTKELLLIAQDSTYYGLDLYGKRNLAELMDRLADVEGIDWIRLHYAFPAGFPRDVLDVMARRPNICNYLDIPLQHGSDNMLKAMRRGITRQKMEALLLEMRERVPGLAIRTTMIAGHPGETEADVQELLQLMETVRFERLGVFTYSHEENTHSYSMADDVPEKEKQDRAQRIMDLQMDISEEFNTSLVGTEQKVLIDRKEGGQWVGRTEYDSPEVDNEVLLPGHIHLRQGDFVQARIVSAGPFDLHAEPIAVPAT